MTEQRWSRGFRGPAPRRALACEGGAWVAVSHGSVGAGPTGADLEDAAMWKPDRIPASGMGRRADHFREQSPMLLEVRRSVEWLGVRSSGVWRIRLRRLPNPRRHLIRHVPLPSRGLPKFGRTASQDTTRSVRPRRSTIHSIGTLASRGHSTGATRRIAITASPIRERQRTSPDGVLFTART